MSEKKVGKRLLTWVLVLVMTLSLLPLNVLADETASSDNVKYGTIDENGQWTATANGTGTNNSTGIDGVKSVSKTAEPTTDEYGKIISNQYDVTLKVELEQTTSTTLPGAAATVLVMDHSGSMNGCASCKSTMNDNPFDDSYYHDKTCVHYKVKQNKVTNAQSRMAAATEAVKSFIKTYSGRFNENSKETTTDNLNLGRWVCLVWFNETGGVVNGGWLDVSNKDAYQKATDTSKWKAEEGTNLDCGLKLADDQLKQDAVKNIGNSLKNVVVLTDGKPTYYLKDWSFSLGSLSPDITIGENEYDVAGNGSSCSENTFQNTKKSATNLKKSASVYTVCFGASGEKIKDYDKANHPEIAVGDYLKNKIATKKAGDKTYAYDAGDTNGLMSAFAAITKDNVSGLNSGTVTDSLPTGVTFKNGTPDGFTSTSENGAYKWELSGATGTGENGKTVYTYTKTYTVTIDPETAEADKDGYVPLNGKTTLTVEGGSVDFPIPAGKVTPKTLTLTATDYTGKYDGGAHGGKVTNPEGATLTYQTKDKDGSWTSATSTEPTLTEVGKIDVKVTAEKKGYETKYAEYTIEVTKRNVTLTSATASKEYDGTPLTNDEVTVGGDGFVEGEGATYNVTGTATNVSDTQTNNNMFNYTLNGNTKPDNYNITKVEGTLTITPVEIELTANSASKKYDGTPLTDDDYTISKGKFVGEEGLASVDVEGIQTEVGSSKNTIKSHTLKQNTLEENYTITYKTGTLEVTTNDKELTVSASGYTGTYDGGSHSGTVTSSPAGATIQYSTDNGETWTADEPTITNVGTITVKVKATLEGYLPAENTYALEVTPKDVTVKADDKHVTVGASAPEYTATVTGMIDDDTVSYTLSCNEYDPETAKAGDEFTITANGNTHQGNYTVEFVNGTLYVDQPTTTKYADVEVRYYKDSVTDVDDGNFLTKIVMRDQVVGDQIDLGFPLIDASQPYGYKPGVQVDGTHTVIEGENVINILYTKLGTIQLGEFICKNFESRYGASTEETFYAYATVTPFFVYAPEQPAEPEQPAAPEQPGQSEQQPGQSEQQPATPSETPEPEVIEVSDSLTLDDGLYEYEGSVTLKAGYSKQFTFAEVSLPAGTYRVEVYEGNGKDDDIVYDDTTYSFTLMVVEKDGGTVASASNFAFCAEDSDEWIPMDSAEKVEFTNVYTYRRPHHPRPKPTVEIEDDDALGLNTTDHFAYIVGYGNGEVRPQNNITRAEVATIFFRLLTDDVRGENLTKTNRYSDVAATSWYNTAVSTLSSMGIITGYPDGTFRPNAAITRAEFAAIAARFDNDGDKTAAKFSDIASHWAKDEISIAYNNGWITGYPNGTFGPQRDITRAETMTLVNRVLNRQPETEDDLLPNMTVWTDNANPKAWYYLAVQEATNSHYYEFKTNSQYEKWTELRETRDWTQLEK